MTDIMIDTEDRKAAEMVESQDDTSLAEGNKIKRKKKKVPKGQQITTRTIKTPPFSYVCLEIIPHPPKELHLDALTVRTYLTSALTQFLGLTGAAISVDILKVDGTICWIRVPREDLSAVVAATGGWIGGNDSEGVGWNVKGSGNWLGSLVSSIDIDQVWNG